MTEKEFYSEIQSRIRDFLPEEYRDASVDLHEVIKDNDTKLTGLTVVRDGENAVPILYLNGPYES